MTDAFDTAARETQLREESQGDGSNVERRGGLEEVSVAEWAEDKGRVRTLSWSRKLKAVFCLA